MRNVDLLKRLPDNYNKVKYYDVHVMLTSFIT